MKYTMSVSKSKIPSKRRRFGKMVSAKSLSSYGRVKKYSSVRGAKKSLGKTSTRSLFTGKFNKDKVRKVIYIVAGFGFFMACLVLMVVGIYLKNLQNSLPSPDELVDRSSDQSTQIFDRNGTLLYTVYGEQNREFVSIDKIPEHTKWALLAAEDVEFYQHKGLDYTGIIRSALKIVTTQKIQGSGSTITQQLVKTTILYDILGDEIYQQTYSRKVKEILITMQVEQQFTKDQILQLYMNEVPLGGVNYGFQAASNAYFGKDVSELDLAESALLAGLIQSPGKYSPLYGTDPEMAKVRQGYVLDQMLKHKDLTGVTEEEIEAARNQELTYKSKRIDIKAPHFVFYVKQILEEKYGTERVERGGLKVTTTLDYSIQEIAEEELVKTISTEGKKYNTYNGSVVVEDPNTGEILAMVGSVDYWNTKDKRIDGNVNTATSPRQVGSSAKPYTYLAAITKGYGPWTLAPDIKMKFGNYEPENWDFKYEGIGTARKNLGRSRNLPAVYTLQYTGIDTLLQVTEKLGITTLKNKGDYGLALALGAGEMKLVEHTAAFGVFANEGEKYDTSAILKVEDSKGEVLEELVDHQAKRVFTEQEIYLLNYTLCDIGGHGDRLGAGYTRVSGKNVCFKTGTTNGPKDVTAVMYHKNLSVGVWAGNNDNSTLKGAWGSSIALPIAYSVTSRLADRYPVETFTRPSGILATSVCVDTGGVPADGVDCKKEATVYMAGHAPQVDKREKVYICKANGLVPENLVLAQLFGLVDEKIYLTTKIENRLQQDTYLKMLGVNYIFEKPQNGNCPLPLGEDNAPIIEISKPSTNQQINKSQNLEIQGTVRYQGTITNFGINIDGSPIQNVSLNQDGSFSISYALNSISTGQHTLTVNAIDSFGKSDSESINFTVVNDNGDNPDVESVNDFRPGRR